MELTDFYLVGHSFGGYSVGHYAVKYPQHVKKLLLLSPIGIKYHTTDELKEYHDCHNLKKGKKQETPAKIFRDIGQWAFFEKKITPASLVRKLPANLALPILKNVLKEKELPEEVLEKILPYFMQICRMPGRTEFGLPIQFESGLRAKMGLDHQSRLASPNFTIPFAIVLGEIDYVKSLDNGACENLIKLK